jgi:DNA polymerase-3 subunit gamma/tau
VVEVDMASHGSVDDIRNLKTSSMLSFAARWRVYLLDEVHSASRAAFDALLKLLEEPPPHTLFILVTTEPDRIPETIRSRCLPYEFRRISIGVIVPRLRFIAAQHGEAERIDERVYELLAQRAKGGMRDAVMSLEQLSYKDGQITEATVRDIFAVTDLPQRLLDAAVKGDMQRGLTVLNEAVESSLPPVSLADDMLTGLNALLCMAYGVQPEMSPVTPEWLAAYSRIDPKLVLDGLASLWDARKLMRPGDPSGFATLRIGYASLVGALTPAVLPASAGLPGIAHTSVPTLPVPEHRLMGTPLASLQPSGFLTTDEALAALEDL